MEQPDSEAGLLPLYQSLHHGVAAGRTQEALDEVYYRRIDRGGQAYGVKQLGLFSTELAALAAFFPGGWQAPVQEVCGITAMLDTRIRTGPGVGGRRNK